MHIVRYRQNSGDVVVGLLDRNEIVRIEGVPSLAQLWQLPVRELRATLDTAVAAGHRTPLSDCVLLAPIDGRTEVWASGVTYERSRVARVEESNQASVYDMVYEADRPELFFKSVAWRVVSDGDPAGIRADSANSVPEPELALVINRHGEIVGATICDDLTARAIEGENPLYLPQAKMYAGSCVLGSRIRPWWEISDPYALDIAMTVTRDGAEVFSGVTSTARMHRTFEELVSWLFRHEQFPDGAVLSTGTGIVPALTQTLLEGDVVQVIINEVGVIEHRVTSRLDEFESLTA